MKILAINSSLKKTGGISQLVIDGILKGAEEKGAECKTLRLSELRINRCIACGNCQKSSRYSCIFSDEDDFEMILEEIDRADVVLVSTPIYVFEMSSLLKTFLERIYGHGKSSLKIITASGLLFHDVDKRLINKNIVSITISDNLENETMASVRSFWRAYCKFMDSRLVGSIERTSAFMLEEANNSELRENVMNALKQAGSELVMNGCLSRKTEKEISKKIIPLPFIVYRILMKTDIGKRTILAHIR